MVSRRNRNRLYASSSSQSTASTAASEQRGAAYLEWLSDCSGIDFLCQRPQSQNLLCNSAVPEVTFDAAKLHEELLDALLQEQKETSTDDSDTTLQRKRKRKNTNIKQVTPVVDTVPVDPSSFFHPQCRLQKDKGKGDAIGSSICAKGRDACLDKLRTKMRLLLEVGDQSSAATMKRRPARVASVEKFVETRSLLELKMGFLSMTYGVLLRWDYQKHVTLVVLRKMCHDSFYPAKSVDVSMQSSTCTPIQYDNLVEKNAIVPRPEGTEVTLLDPPYLVPRPEEFEPPMLVIRILALTGVTKKNNWYMQLSYENESEKFSFTHDADARALIPKKVDTLKRSIYDPDLDLGNLELRLYEGKSKRLQSKSLLCMMKLPLDSLTPQASHVARPTRMQIPLTNDADVCVHLEMLLVSNYSHWVSQELDARDQQSARVSIRREEIVEEECFAWSWICSVC